MNDAKLVGMISPLTYCDQIRDDNLLEFCLKLIVAFLKKFCLY
jgi:hypothetical protein